jgi:RNA polymerase sigma factor FliA
MAVPGKQKCGLTQESAEAVWRAWHERGDATARERLILSYAPMVKALACRKARELPPHVELDDLVSCGLMGLMAAVEGFDPAKGVGFEQYARIRISGAIGDELRRQDWAPRSVRRAGREISRGRSELLHRHGRPPSDEELSMLLQISTTELHAHLSDLARADVASLNAPAIDDASPVEVADTVQAGPGDHDPESTLLSDEFGRVLRSAVASLPKRQQEVFMLAYVDRLHGAEIGRMIGVSESRVSQLLNRIRQAIRDQLDRYDLDRRGIPNARIASTDSSQQRKRDTSNDTRFDTAA